MMTPTGLAMILRADSLSRCRKRETKSSKYVGQTEQTLRTRGYALVHIQRTGLLQRPFVPAEQEGPCPIAVSLAASRAFQKIISS